MRTKTLLIAAAALVAGIFSSDAQVYSANVVGYVQVPLGEGFNLISTPLDYDGTGTNSCVTNIFGTSLPVGSVVFQLNGATFTNTTYAANKSHTATNWTANLLLNPGVGYWLSIPVGSYGGGTSNATIVGTVLQGNLTNQYVTGAGFHLVGSQVPITGGMQTNLGYAPSVGDVVFTYNKGGSVAYSNYTFSVNKNHTATNWAPSQPIISIGQGFWLDSATNAPWTNTFNVQ